MKKIQKIVGLIGATILSAVLFTAVASAATYTVNTLTDEADLSCVDGDCSLRDAITTAVDGDTITFDVTLDGQTIALGALLDTVTVGTRVTIDGDFDGSAGPDITIDGNLVSHVPFDITASNVVMDGVIVNGNATGTILVTGNGFTLKNSMLDTNGTAFTGHSTVYSIRIDGNNASIGTGVSGEGNTFAGGIYVNNSTGHSILGNYIGVSSGGVDVSTTSGPNSGISISGTSVAALTIGGTTSTSRNVIGNFSENGIIMVNTNLSAVINILGNYIGVTPAGTAAAPGVGSGIYLGGGTAGTINIGSAASGAGNVISGNGYGIRSGTGDDISGATVSIQGNYIGTNATGTAAIANSQYGISMEGSLGTVTVGPTRNLISGNTTGGVLLIQPIGTFNLYGSYVGLGANGSTTIPNGGRGISIGANSTTINIGSADPANRNVISGNTTMGIEQTTSSSLTLMIRNNYIGISADGTTAKANGTNGIGLSNLTSSNIDIYSNVISGNTENGMELSGGDQVDVQGNYIGTDSTGMAAIPNGMYGIYLNGGTNAIIGAATVGGNVISGNVRSGIHVDSTATATILNNKIGTDVTGAVTTLGNGNLNTGAGLLYGGIDMIGASNITIGSSTLGNTISGNYGQGILMINGSSVTIKGNTINANIAGDPSYYTHGEGIVMIDFSGSSVSTIAIGGTGAGEGNTINDNEGEGIYLLHTAALAGTGIDAVNIYGNTIGQSGVGNGRNGIYVYDYSASGLITNITIGHASAANTIGYNASNGVKFSFIPGSTITSNTISSNTGMGIHVYASSPTISSNTIASNGSYGIKLEPYYGADLTPAVTTDDVRSNPGITGNTINSNIGVQLYAVDTAATNKSTLHSDNTITPASGIAGIEQYWRGALQISCGGTILTSAISSATINGASLSFTTYNGTYWGPTGFTYADVSTWGLIKEFDYTTGGRTVLTPNAISVTPTNGATSCTTTAGSNSFNGSTYNQTASMALTIPTPDGGGTILLSTSSSSSPGEDAIDTETEEDSEPEEEPAVTPEPTEPTPEPTPPTVTPEPVVYDRPSPNEAPEPTPVVVEPEPTDPTLVPVTVDQIEYVIDKLIGYTDSTDEPIPDFILEVVRDMVESSTDIDNDGISNEDEITNGTDQYSVDSDGDGEPDNLDTDPLNSEISSDTWDSIQESDTQSVDSDGDGLDDAAEYILGSNPQSSQEEGRADAVSTIFGRTENSSQVGFGGGIVIITKNGFAVTGKGKPNSETEVTVTLSDGSALSKKVQIDSEGKYIALLEDDSLKAMNTGEMVLIQSKDGKPMVAKVSEETVQAPEIEFEGIGVEVAKDAEESIPRLWTTELILTRVPNIIKTTKFIEAYEASRELVLAETKDDKIVLKGHTAPRTAVVVTFKSVIFSSVVISDKDGNFELEVPDELRAELQNADSPESVLHEFIGFSVDYKKNSVSSLVKGLLRFHSLNKPVI